MEVGFLDETPEFDVPLSQYNLLEETAGLTKDLKKGKEKDLKRNVSQFTRIFKGLLDDGFQSMGAKDNAAVDFKEIITRGVQEHCEDGQDVMLSKSDVALS